MQEFVIITDSTTDLSPELIAQYELEVIPMLFNLGDDEYRNFADGRELSFQDFYDRLRKGETAGTVQINAGSFADVFEPHLQAGRDVLYLSFSSALSGTCASSMLAVQDLAAKYPERKIYAVDSLCASMGEGLLACLAAKQKQAGKSIEEVRDWLVENRLRLCHWFTVDDLNHLKRGGRVSATAAVIGTMLGIKPILHVDDEGRLIPVGKVRGRRQALEQLVSHMAETAQAPGDQTVFISHGDAGEDARFVAELLRERMGVRDIQINFIGPVIGAHSGPGTIALFFLGSKR